jgi:AraC-like DNA-binding protein
MLSSAVRTFSDPDDFAAAIRQSSVDLTITGRGRFAAKLIRIDLHRLWMQRLSDNLPRIARADIAGGRVIVGFQIQSGPGLTWNGMDLQPNLVVRTKGTGVAYHRSIGNTNFGAMSLSIEDMATAGATLAGRDLAAQDNVVVVRPSPAAMAKLQRLHAAAGQLAETTPEIIAHPEAARGLEHALIEAMVGSLVTGDALEERSAQRRHEIIMRRFHREIEESPDQALYVPEICRAIGVADRTLRICCQERLGMSPKQFLLVRRMDLARRDLSRAAPTATTVTEVASRYGFWQFGHFAGAYKALFGELPSATLGRLPGE